MAKAKTYKLVDDECDAMHGPIPLYEADQVGPDAFGVYLLVHESVDDELIVTYVGRGNIVERMSTHRRERDSAVAFYYRSLDTDVEAYFEECRLYHHYEKRKHLDNLEHPKRPPGTLRGPNKIPPCSELGCNGEPLA